MLALARDVRHDRMFAGPGRDLLQSVCHRVLPRVEDGIAMGCPGAGWGERDIPAVLRQQRLSWQPPGCRIPC